MTKACLYTRYSSHSQTERSIEGQIQDAQRYAEAHDIQIVKIYEEPHRSGTNADSRPVFQQMIKDSEKRPWDMVLVWKLDRFARNRYDAAMYRAKLKRVNIKIQSVMEQITDSAEGVILESLLEGMAEYYSANLSENIRRGQRLTREKGEWHGGEPPFGYSIENKRLVENEKTAPVIRKIFEDYKNGAFPAEIVNYLNSHGIKTTRNKPFTYSVLGNILRCERYIGITRYQGEIVNSDGVPLIDQATFEAVQKRLEQRKRNPQSAHALVSFLLTDKLFCGICGEKMIGCSGTGKKGKTYYYYACTKAKHGQSCVKKNEQKQSLEDFVVFQTMEAITDTEVVNSIAQKVVEKYNEEFNDNKITETQKEIERLNHELDKLTDQLIEAPNQRIKDRITEKIDSISLQLDELEDELQGQLQVSKIHRLNEDDVKAYIKGFQKGNPNDETFREYLIETFINSIYVFDNDDKTASIVFNYNVCPSETVTFLSAKEMYTEFERASSKWSGQYFVRTLSHRVFSVVIVYNR